MNILYVLIPLSIVLVAVAIWGFFWAVRNNQFDDLDTPAMNILDDEMNIKGARSEERGAKRESKSG